LSEVHRAGGSGRGDNPRTQRSRLRKFKQTSGLRSLKGDAFWHGEHHARHLERGVMRAILARWVSPNTTEMPERIEHQAPRVSQALEMNYRENAHVLRIIT